MDPAPIDMINRDPNSINSHVQVGFEDVLAEPDGVHSPECVWKLANKCFTCSRDIAYTLFALCYGVPYAFFWGCEFAYLSFAHIWIITPAISMYMVWLKSIKIIYGACVRTCCDPCFESCGRILSDVRVTHA
ncbi:caveolin-1-like isoform X2 [Anneissia japonica]|uniref:caveolin-1-like isoform X2 n=1 Tax=Anneissia japonica TaxID=1529436 RepID=UPI001425A97C|nr:caveolin-1-like isoform X2 [Anneissia japonica]